MKKHINIVLSAWVLLAFPACQSEEDILPQGNSELTLSSSIEEMKGTAGSRATGEGFFQAGNEIEVNLTTITSGGTETTQPAYTYAYGNDRIFRGNPGYHFALDDSYIKTLNAKWPTAAVRASGIKTDQQLLTDYKASDWMSGSLVSGAAYGIAPTNTPVPLVFTRENVLLDFELVGQNNAELKVKSLWIDIQDSDNSIVHWAYCGNSNGHAELILLAGSKIFSKGNRLTGGVLVSGQASDFAIIFPETDLVLEAGHRYLITLTPQDHFMNAHVYVSGFVEEEGGIGIPLQQPTLNADGSFQIDTPAQLICLSYLMRNYNDGTTFVWSTGTYVISSGLLLTEDDMRRYIPIPRSLFTGSMQGADGAAVTEVATVTGEVFPIFDTNN